MAPPRQYPIRNPGYMFGFWKVLEYKSRANSTKRDAGYDVLCTLCGETYFHILANLEKGHSTKCGICGRKTIYKFNLETYSRTTGLSQTTIDRLINRWYAAKARCTIETTSKYVYYGGRGVRMCTEWLSGPYNFIIHAMQLPGFDNAELELDRVNNDGNYEPGNIRFCTRSENMLNSRHSKQWKESQIYNTNT